MRSANNENIIFVSFKLFQRFEEMVDRSQRVKEKRRCSTLGKKGIIPPKIIHHTMNITFGCFDTHLSDDDDDGDDDDDDDDD